MRKQTSLSAGLEQSSDGIVRQNRPGAVIVELALILPFLIILLLGICEIGQMLRVEALITQAVRRGCAVGAQPRRSETDVEASIAAALNDAGLPAHCATVRVLINDEPGQLSLARANDKITVILSVSIDAVSWTGASVFRNGSTHQSAAMTMLRQG